MMTNIKNSMIIKEKPEDFIVIEKLTEKYNKKIKKTFDCNSYENFSEKIKQDNSNYFLLKIEKKNFSHFKMLKEIKKLFRLKEKEIGIPGIKDKKAITDQYITIKNNSYVKRKILDLIKEYYEKNCEEKNFLLYKKVYDENTIEEKILKIYFEGTTNEKLTIGLLEENEFIIKIKNLKEKNIIKLKFLEEKIKKEKNFLFIPNYFGLQRFGIENYNPIIGYYILKQEYEKAVEYIKKQEVIEEKNTFLETIKSISRKKRMLYISSFQSIIFNLELKEKILFLKNKQSSINKILFNNKDDRLELLKQVIIYSLDYEFLSLEEQKKLSLKFLDEEIKIVAFDRDMNEFKKKVLKFLGLNEKNFITKHMPDLMFEPYNRKIFQEVLLKKIILEKEKKEAKLNFVLKKGSYATITLKAIEQL